MAPLIITVQLLNLSSSSFFGAGNEVSAFQPPKTSKRCLMSRKCIRRNDPFVFESHNENNEDIIVKKQTIVEKDNMASGTMISKLRSLSLAIALAIVSSMALSTTNAENFAASAYIPTDYASETVQTVINDLKSASGNCDETFKVYENIAGIITEGKGVGGMINYKGVNLERYKIDEDTSIYNPGLSLLTESEKERLVEAVIDARKASLASGQWSENNQYAYDFLREKLDPFHMVELSGFFKIVPIYSAILYLAVLSVQQFFRDAFQIAYIAGAVAFFLPIAILIAAGP